MFVIEFLRTLKAEDVVNKLLEIPYLLEEIDWDNRLSNDEKILLKNKVKERYIEEYNKIISIKDEDISFDSSKILFVSLRLESSGEDYDCHLIELEKIKTKLDDIKIKDYENIANFKNPLYGIMFSKRKEVLGFKISNKTIDKNSHLIVAREILRELTSFSLDEEMRESKIGEIVDSLKELDKKANNEEEKYYSLDEMREILGWKKEEEDKIEELRKDLDSYFEIQKRIANLILDIQEILIEENIIDKNFNEN